MVIAWKAYIRQTCRARGHHKRDILCIRKTLCNEMQTCRMLRRKYIQLQLQLSSERLVKVR
jgi:hypothetical protein